MKIAFATTWESKCGIAVYSQSLVAEIEKRESVEVVNLDPGAVKTPERLAAALNESDVAHIQFQYPFFGGMALHKNWFLKTLRRLDVPLVLTIHELDLGVSDSFPIQAYKQWFNRHIFNRQEIDRIVVHTVESRNLLETLGISIDKVRVIPEGVPRVDPPLMTSEAAKAVFGLSGRRVMTIFGFVVRRKGYDIVLKALKDLPEDIVLLIAGGTHGDDRGGFMDELKQIIRTGRLEDRTVITGYLSDDRVPLAMAATDVILAPFTEISNSSSTMRSIAYEKPIIASDLPLMREINGRTPCLSLFRNGEPVDLAAKARALLDNENRLAEAAAVVRSYAKNHSVARAAAETISVYEELLEE